MWVGSEYLEDFTSFVFVLEISEATPSNNFVEKKLTSPICKNNSEL